jgi:hypothetical protein
MVPCACIIAGIAIEAAKPERRSHRGFAAAVGRAKRRRSARHRRGEPTTMEIATPRHAKPVISSNPAVLCRAGRFCKWARQANSTPAKAATTPSCPTKVGCNTELPCLPPRLKLPARSLRRSPNAEIPQNRQRKPNYDCHCDLDDVGHGHDLQQATAGRHLGYRFQASTTTNAVSPMATRRIDQSTISKPRSLPAAGLS